VRDADAIHSITPETVCVGRGAVPAARRPSRQSKDERTTEIDTSGTANDPSTKYLSNRVTDGNTQVITIPTVDCEDADSDRTGGGTGPLQIHFYFTIIFQIC
jgi:hypothetical protein